MNLGIMQGVHYTSNNFPTFFQQFPNIPSKCPLYFEKNLPYTLIKVIGYFIFIHTYMFFPPRIPVKGYKTKVMSGNCG